jgi:hypothetical protein
LPEGVFRKRFGGEGERLTRGSHPSGLKIKTELTGARGARWSPASIHGEAGEKEGTYGLTGLSRVCGWWSWSSAGTTSTAATTPADGGSVESGSL